MYRISVQPLFEKSIFKPEDSELVIDREYGNISIYNKDKDCLISATKDIIKKLDENIYKYKILLENLKFNDNEFLENKVNSTLNDFIELYKRIRKDYSDYLDLKDDCNRLLSVIENNNEENNETYDEKNFNIFSQLQSKFYNLYLDNIKHLNDHQSFMRIKLFDSIVDIENMKTLLSPRVKPVDSLYQESTSTEIKVLKNNIVPIYEGGTSNTLLIDNDLSDNNDDSKVYPEYVLVENGFSSYEKDVGELVYLHELSKKILQTSLHLKYKKLNENFENNIERVNDKVDSNLVENFKNSYLLKFNYNKIENIINEYYNENKPFTKTVNNGNNSYEITDVIITIKNIDIKF